MDYVSKAMPDGELRREGNSSISRSSKTTPSHISRPSCSADSLGRALCARRHSRSVHLDLGGSRMHSLPAPQRLIALSFASRHLPPPCASRPVPCTVSLNCSMTPITRRMVFRSSCLPRLSTSLGPSIRLSSWTSSTC